jgi:type IV secretory pathway VirB2 component (pilin)
LNGNRRVAIAVLGVLAVAWIGLMWLFSLYDSFWWSVLSVAVAIPLLLWASASSRLRQDADVLDGEDD